ncbi:uncharacterized protein LOC135808202 isoform X2 [Sycon ciliatum]|uniref:uncharacterized protein LOC135808202 isoform X2 n=1 Tax=Sycon ciliatum TaxID=27933 RepID=UPI0031F70C07
MMDSFSPKVSPVGGSKRRKSSQSSGGENSISSRHSTFTHSASPLSGAERTRGARSPYIRRVNQIDEKRRKKSSERNRRCSRSPLKESQEKCVKNTNSTHCDENDPSVSSTHGHVCGATMTIDNVCMAMAARPTQSPALGTAAGVSSGTFVGRTTAAECIGPESVGSGTYALCDQPQAAGQTFDFKAKFLQLLDTRMTKPEQELVSTNAQFREYMHASSTVVQALRSELKESESRSNSTREECNRLQEQVAQSDASLVELRASNEELLRQLEVAREELAAEKLARQEAEERTQEELQALRQSEGDWQEQLSVTTAESEDLRIQTEALRGYIAEQAEATSSEEVDSMKHIIDCYSRMTGFQVQVDVSKWDENTESFRCFFTDAVGMEGHGFSLLHHLDCKEVEYSPEVQSVADTPRKSLRRRSVGRTKITTLPEYLREDILFDDARGSPRFTFLMLQALVGQLKQPPPVS